VEVGGCEGAGEADAQADGDAAALGDGLGGGVGVDVDVAAGGRVDAAPVAEVAAGRAEPVGRGCGLVAAGKGDAKHVRFGGDGAVAGRVYVHLAAAGGGDEGGGARGPAVCR